jgi:hypothetical protein
MVVGEIIAFIVVVLDNPRYVRKLKANNDIPVPEWRLPISMVGGVLFAGMPLSYPLIPFTANSPSFITSLPSHLYPHICTLTSRRIIADQLQQVGSSGLAGPGTMATPIGSSLCSPASLPVSASSLSSYLFSIILWTRI